MPVVAERIPFAEAISEPLLLKTRFEELSFAQQTALKILYGVPLSDQRFDKDGWSELDYFSIFQGGAEYDELGFIKRITKPVSYKPEDFDEAWIIGGRRLGKTDAFASTIVTYESLLGGHEAFVRKGQPVMCFQIAQDKKSAKHALHFIKASIESSPLLAKEIVLPITAEEIRLKNGVTISVAPPTVKSVRGYANAVTVMDEVGSWYMDSDSANPDYEIYRAVSPGQAQFPHRKIVGISSPWNKSGLLYKFFEAGTNGCKLHNSLNRDEFKNVLVLHGTTASFGNPRVTKEWLKSEQRKDARAFERECLAIFQDSISGFLSPVLLSNAVDGRIIERAPDANAFYVAAIDPAFKGDSFAFTIVHQNEGRGVVQDLVRRWTGSVTQPLNPTEVFREIAPILEAYHISAVYSDQYQIESLQQIASQFNFAIIPVMFTAKSKSQIYANLQQLLNQQNLRLLDDPETLRELKSLERNLTAGGIVQIGAPSGMHDDLATVIAIAAKQAAWMSPSPPEPPPPIPTVHDKVQRMLEKRAMQAGNPNSDWD